MASSRSISPYRNVRNCWASIPTTLTMTEHTKNLINRLDFFTCERLQREKLIKAEHENWKDDKYKDDRNMKYRNNALRKIN